MAVGVLYGVLIGLHVIYLKMFAGGIDPLLFSWVFLVVTNLALALYLGARRSWAVVRVAVRRRWPFFLSVGMVNVGIQVFTVKGTDLVQASAAGVLVRSDLVFGLILGMLLFKERARPRELLGGAFMVAGLWMVSDLSWRGLHGSAWGAFDLALSGLLVAVNALTIKYALAGISGPAIAYVNTLVASSSLAVLLLVSGQWRQLAAFGHPAVLGGTLVVGLNFAASLAAYYYILERFPVWKARSFTLASPVVAALGGWVWFGEPVDAHRVVGMLFVMLGMGVMFWAARGSRIAAGAPATA